MAQQCLLGFKPEQGVGQAAVAHKDFGRFHQSFADILVPWHQPTDQKQIDQQVKVARDCLARNGKPLCQGCGIQDAALHMGQHGPEASQGCSRNPRPQRRDIPFQISAQEIFAPTQACSITPRLKAVGEPTAKPERTQTVIANFVQQKRAEFDIAYASCKRFCRLMQKCIAC